jgi:hypothetical protein
MATSDSIISSNELILAESHFEPDSVGVRLDGWSRQGDCTLTQSPTGGNPGGCLMAVDAATGQVFYYVAPEKFLGDKSSAVRLTYDIKWVASAGVPVFAWDREVELAGGGMVLIYHPGGPPRNIWVSCVVPFAPSAHWTNITSRPRPSTEDDFKVVLSSLGKLAIRGEFGHGPETGYLDNVVMYRAGIGQR